MKNKIEWHKFSYPDSLPPLGIGILITDGEVITVTSIDKEWNNGEVKDYILNAHGWWGYEWDYDFGIENIKYWALLPDMPNGDKK